MTCSIEEAVKRDISDEQHVGGSSRQRRLALAFKHAGIFFFIYLFLLTEAEDGSKYSQHLPAAIQEGKKKKKKSVSNSCRDLVLKLLTSVHQNTRPLQLVVKNGLSRRPLLVISAATTAEY